jgi:hypothetical protein
VRYWGQWRVLAIGSNSLEPSTRYIRLFNIDNDGLDFADFAPWEEMGGIFSLAETELQALSDFLTGLADEIESDATTLSSSTYFTPASTAEYLACGIPPDLLARFTPLWFHDTDEYLYHPDNVVKQHAEGTSSFVSIGWWTSPNRLAGTAHIEVASYSANRIAQMRKEWAEWLKRSDGLVHVDPQLIYGEASLLVSAGALRAWVALLDKRLRQRQSL